MSACNFAVESQFVTAKLKGGIGGKAANLHRVRGLGLAVPPFYVVTTQALRFLLDSQPSGHCIRKLLLAVSTRGGFSPVFVRRHL
jgi:phosphoenolpyruvate synthase/pyruvate phosphate dikinase